MDSVLLCASVTADYSCVLQYVDVEEIFKFNYKIDDEI